jgi:hypothetical protein
MSWTMSISNWTISAASFKAAGGGGGGGALVLQPTRRIFVRR